MPEKKEKKLDTDVPVAFYFKSLTIKDVKCFKGEHRIDLSDEEELPAQWTVILGNNNTGKTTILKCLASLEASIFTTRLEKKPEVFYVPTSFLKREHGSFPCSAGSEFFLTKSKRIKIITQPVVPSIGWRWFNTGDTGGGSSAQRDRSYENLKVEAYGASRKMAQKGMLWSDKEARHLNLFQNSDLFNSEEWLLQLNLAKLQGKKAQQSKAKKIIDKAKEIMTSGLLPDVTDLRFGSEQRGQSFDNFIEFKTDFGWIRLNDLGYGYQTMLAWVLDLVRRMFERYPESTNPIREPSIVLVDEIDLHLHPEWQRKIISHLTKYFPNTQFIVTAHSPLVVQSAEKINLVLLDKEGDHVTIRQPQIPTYQGWSLEEILTELMGLGERTHSEKYLELIRQFETALDNENYESAQAAYDELDKILHPESHQRKLLRLQMSSLTPA